MKFTELQYSFLVVLLANICECQQKRKVLASCGLSVKPVAVFPLDGEYGGEEAIHNDIKAKLTGVSTIQGPDGKQDGGYMLHGKHGSYIEIPNSERGKLDISKSISILVYIRPITANLGPILNYKPDGHGVQVWTNGRQDGKGILTARFNKRTLSLSKFVSKNVLNLNQWNFIGATYDYNTDIASLWYDGREVLSTKLNSYNKYELATQFPIRLGALTVSGLGAYEGGISCLQLYSTVLTGEQIVAAMKACMSASPVTSLSVNVVPSSLKVEVNQSLSLSGFTQDGGVNGIFTFNFGDGRITTPDENTAAHVYGAPGNYVIVVLVTDRCKLGTPIQKELKVIVTYIVKRLQGVTLKSIPASPGHNAVITLTFPTVSSFNCSVQFEDGQIKFISSPLFYPVDSVNISHVYTTVGLHNVSAVCWNRINSCNGTTVISVQYTIEGLTIQPIIPSVTKNGENIIIQWSVSQGSYVKYQAIVNANTSINVMTSSDTKQGRATITAKDYGIVGRHTVTITASNDVTSPRKVIGSFEVMYPVSPFNVTLTNNIGHFMVKKPIIVTITAIRHDLYDSPLYTIDLGEGRAPIITNATSLTYIYARHGCTTVNVTGSNAVSSLSVLRPVCIEQQMDVLKGLSVYSTPAKVDENVTIHLHLNNGSHFNCSVRFSDGVEILTGEKHSLDVRVQRRFPRPGIYDVTADCWNKISHSTASTRVSIQHVVKDFVLHPINPVVLGSNITIIWSVTQGTNITFNVTFMSRNLDFITNGNMSMAVVTADQYNEEGLYSVTVTARNEVTHPVTLEETFSIEKLLSGLKLSFVYTENNINISGLGRTKTYFPHGFPVSGRTGLVSQSKYADYNYSLNGVAMESWKNKKAFTLPPLNVGIHNISVTVVNNVSGINHKVQVFFQEKIKFLDRTLLCSSPVVIGDKARIRLSVGAVPRDSCLFVHVTNDTYRYGNSHCNELITSNISSISNDVIPSYIDLYHVMTYAGKTAVTVQLGNIVSMDTLACDVEVLLIACTYPVINLGHIRRQPSLPRIIKRSESLDIHSEINVFCPASEGTVFDWKIYQFNVKTNDSQAINYTGSSLPSFRIEKRSLWFGLYRVSLTVRMSEPSLQEYMAEASGYVSIVPSDLVAKINGGTTLRRGMGPDIMIDGSSSYDPDVGKNKLSGITFLWLCRQADSSFPPHLVNLTSNFTVANLLQTPTNNNGGCYTGNGFIISHSSPTFALKTSKLGLEKYVVKLVIRKGSRVSSAVQTIEIVEGEPPSVDIICAENCREKVNPSERLSLQAKCNGAGCWGDLFYEWTLYILTETNAWTTRDYNSSLATSKGGSPITIVGKNTLEGGRQYRIEVTASRQIGPKGLASEVFNVNSPPFGGKCDVSPRVGHVLMTKFNFRCVDWKDPDEPLSYQFLFSSNGGPQTLLYYGAKPEIQEGLPLGSSSANYTQDIEIRIADRLGAKTNFYLSVESRPPHQDSSQVMDEITSMTSGNNSVLDSLRKSGQAQAVTLTINTISSLLNTPTNGSKDSEERKKKSQVRSKMIGSLSEIKSTNMESLNQVTSAMTQATQVNDEVDPQAQVTSADTLSHVGKMLGSHDDDDVGFDSMESSADSFFSAFGNVVGMVSSSAAQSTKTKTNSSIAPVNNQDKAKSSAKSLIGSMSGVAKSLLKRKLPQEQATTFVKPSMRASLKRTSVEDMDNDDLSLGSEGKFVASIGKDLMNMNLVDGKTSLDQEAFTFKDNIYSWDKSSSDITSPVLSLSYSVNGKPLAVNGLSNPVQFIMERKQPLPDPQIFVLTISRVNYHRLVVATRDDSFSIEVSPLNCSYSLNITVSRTVKPTSSEYDRVKHINSSRSTDNSSRCLYKEGDNVLFLSNGNLSSGVYYIGISTDVPGSPPNATLKYSMRVYASKCLYWSEKDERWKGDGCMGGPLTNSTHIQCLATHLTSFGSGMFTAPNPIDFSRVLVGFKEAFETGNVVVLFTVLGLFLVYSLLAIWARRTDNKDTNQLTSILLPPIKDTYNYTYEITIVTGSRRYAGSTANVFCDIHGENAATGAYPLLVPNNKGFPRRSFRTFIISTPSSIGAITGIRIWHDCSGNNPSWFLRKILLRDTQTEEEWLFAADVWLGLDVGNGEVEAFLKPNTVEDLSEFNVMFNDKIRKEICDKHLWFSLLLRPQCSPFTRLQRLSCCLSFLCTTMIASAMFYGVGPQPGDTSGNFHVGPLTMNLRTIIIAIQSAFVVVPVNVVIVAFFRFSAPVPEQHEENRRRFFRRCLPSCGCRRPCRDGNAHDFQEDEHNSRHILKKAGKQGARAMEIEENKSVYQKKDSELAGGEKIEKDEVQQDATKTDDKDNFENSQFETEETNEQDETEKNQDLITNEQDGESVHDEIDNEKDETDNENKKCKCCSCFYRLKAIGLPFWVVYIGWFLCISASLLSGLFVIFYSMMWGKEKSNEWLATMCISFIQDLLISQPIKVLITALLFALIVRQAKQENERIKPRRIETIPIESQPDYNDENYGDSVAPLDRAIVRKLRKQREKIAEIKGIMIDICYYIIILVIVILLGQQYRSNHTYHIKKTMEMMFVTPPAGLDRPGTAEINDVKTTWDWINQTLIGGLTDDITHDYSTGLNNLGMRVLHARLRQKRLKAGDCKMFSLECKVYYSSEQEDKGYHDVKWTKSSNNRYHDSPWQYSTPRQANHSLWVSGIYNDYSGGGFNALLENTTAGSRSVINQLAKSSWIDNSTRAVFAEFNLYSANTDLVTSVTVMFEMPSYGGVVSSIRVVSFKMPSQSVMTSIIEGVAFLFLAFMMFRTIMVLFYQKLKFFFKLANVFDIVFVTVSVVVVILRMLLTNAQGAQRNYYLESPSSYIDFHKCAAYADIVSSAFAFMFFIAVARFGAFITLFSCIQEFTCTVKKSLEQLGNFILLLILLIIAYGSFFVLAFADQWGDFRNFSVAVRTLFSFILSNLSGRQLPEPTALALPVVCGYSLTMIFLMLNIFRAILGENHKQAIESSRRKKEENSLSEVAKYMMVVLQQMVNKTSVILEVPRPEKSDSERRLISQTSYITNNQSVRINRFLNDFYAEDFYEDIFILDNLELKSKKQIRDFYL